MSGRRARQASANSHTSNMKRLTRTQKTLSCSLYASVNSSCAHPPPGNCGAFACLVSPGGGALVNLARPGGRAFAYPRAFDTHGVSDSKSKHGGFYRKGPAVRRRLDRPLRTGQTCGGFFDFMHFFIAYQGTTIAVDSEIGNDQRESTNACFFEQGFKQNLVAMIL